MNGILIADETESGATAEELMKMGVAQGGRIEV